MISSERTAEIFTALILYYENGYDYFKYNGRMKRQPRNVSLSFNIIADKFRCESAVELYFSISIISQMSAGTFKKHITNYSNKDAFISYQTWCDFIKKFDTNLKNFILTKANLKKLITTDILFRKYIQDEIPLEFVAYLSANSRGLRETITKTDDPILINIMEVALRYYKFLVKKQVIDLQLENFIRSLE